MARQIEPSRSGHPLVRRAVAGAIMVGVAALVVLVIVHVVEAIFWVVAVVAVIAAVIWAARELF